MRMVLAFDAPTPMQTATLRPRFSCCDRPAILHCTTRDHNRLGLQAQIWGARALGIETVLAAMGDFVALADQGHTTTVRDIDVFGLIEMARASGLQTGVVFDFAKERGGLAKAADRLRRKIDCGADFAVTQPVYDERGMDDLGEAVLGLGLPIVLGILPLRSPRHADFLHNKVVGIDVPASVREKMHAAADPIAEGIRLSRELASRARQRFAGACLMPPFDHFEDLGAILTG